MDRLKDLDDNLTIKVGKTSITIKDNQNKTRGIIKDIETWVTMQFNKKAEWNRRFKKQGIDIQNLSDNLIFKDGNVYYMFNKYNYNKHKDFIERLKDKEGFDVTSNIKALEKIEKELELCNKLNIEVLRVNL